MTTEPPRTCARHPSRQGIGICKGCGATVCEECGGREEGILFCRACLAARLTRTASASRASGVAALLGGLAATAAALWLLSAVFAGLLRSAARWGVS